MTRPSRGIDDGVSGLLVGVIAACVVACVVACGARQAPRSTPSVEAHALVEAGAVLVDVRTPEEFAARHIEGAVNVPVDEVMNHLDELPADRTVVVYCQSGRRAERAAQSLREAGHTVHVLGGIDDW